MKEVGKEIQLPPPISTIKANGQNDEFRATLEACKEHSSGEAELDLECVHALVGRDPGGAEAYVKSCCSAAEPDVEHLKHTAAVAKSYKAIFDDLVLSRLVYERAKKVGASDVIELLTTGSDDGTTRDVN